MNSKITTAYASNVTKRINSTMVLATALVLVAAFGAALAASASGRARTRHRHAHVGRGNVAKFNREAYAYQANVPLATEARRYQVIVLQAPYGKLVKQFHRYNPHIKVYMYEFMMFARANDPFGLELCTNLPAVQKHNWFLRGSNGQPVTPINDHTAYATDPGIASYQVACAEHAVAYAKRYGFDGVFLDGVGSLPDYQLGGHVDIPKYPTPGAWTSAMTSFLRTATGVMHRNGLKVIANIGGPQAWKPYTSLIDGAEEESWTDAGMGPAQQLPWWRLKLQNAAWAQAHHKYVLLHSYNNSFSANVYGLASMLLVANGYASYSTSNSTYVSGENWFSVYSAARHLGAPLGRYHRRRDGLYARRFQHGVVLVNPSTATRGPVHLHGVYSGSGLKRVRVVTLSPLSGLILLRR